MSPEEYRAEFRRRAKEAKHSDASIDEYLSGFDSPPESAKNQPSVIDKSNAAESAVIADNKKKEDASFSDTPIAHTLNQWWLPPAILGAAGTGTAAYLLSRKKTDTSSQTPAETQTAVETVSDETPKSEPKLSIQEELAKKRALAQQAAIGQFNQKPIPETPKANPVQSLIDQSAAITQATGIPKGGIAPEIGPPPPLVGPRGPTEFIGPGQDPGPRQGGIPPEAPPPLPRNMPTGDLDYTGVNKAVPQVPPEQAKTIPIEPTVEPTQAVEPTKSPAKPGPKPSEASIKAAQEKAARAAIALNVQGELLANRPVESAAAQEYIKKNPLPTNVLGVLHNTHGLETAKVAMEAGLGPNTTIPEAHAASRAYNEGKLPRVPTVNGEAIPYVNSGGSYSKPPKNFVGMQRGLSGLGLTAGLAAASGGGVGLYNFLQSGKGEDFKKSLSGAAHGLLSIITAPYEAGKAAGGKAPEAGKAAGKSAGKK